jgi:hypothetical protein
MAYHDDLKILRRDLNVAQNTLTQAIAAAFPVGRRYFVRVSSSQKQGTLATVISHGTGRFAGEVRVQLDTPKKPVRDIPWEWIT